MSDRELLEYAAKAAGYIPESLKGNPDYLEGFLSNWNPLTDDGDALRLAVKLRLDVEWIDPETVFVSSFQHVANNEPYAATRRAIVKAAAEIGKERA